MTSNLCSGAQGIPRNPAYLDGNVHFISFYSIPYPSTGRLLQLGKDGIDARDADIAGWFLLGVDDLAVVDDDGVARSARAEGPAEGLAEGGLIVGCEELEDSWLAFLV